MQASFRISYLDLSHNEFGEAAGVALGEALGESVASIARDSHCYSVYAAGDVCVCVCVCVCVGLQERARCCRL